MQHTSKYSYVVLRFGLAAVFFWFGIDKFFHPAVWLDAWISFKVPTYMYLIGVIETLIGLSLVTGVFIRFFSALGVLILLVNPILHGLNPLTIRDIGLIAALLAILVWSDRNF